MLMNSLSVKNFRGLKNIEIPLSSFVCIIGENNSGKSSVLLALYYFLTGEAISEKYFFNKDESIKIEVEIEDINDEDLLRLSEEHRTKMINEIKDKKLKLVRIYKNGKNILCLKKSVPIDPRFDDKKIKEVLTGKSGKNIQIAIQDHLEDFKEVFEGVTTQGNAKKIIASIIDEMDDGSKIEKERALPSGIPNSIQNLLPLPILISAVKDLTDDAKRKSSTTFGKIIKILLDLIEDKDIVEVVKSLDTLKKFLNKIEDNDGIISDDYRLKQLNELEEITNFYLKDNFPNTSIEVNVLPPTIEELFSSSKILIDDGIKGDIDTKGDGLKRAVIFALLRTYNEMKKHSTKHNRPYIFLFEEPELYLHPASQKILFEALCNLAEDNSQVVTTTHSPIFFTLDYTGIFIKMKKVDVGEKPFSNALYLDIKKEMDKNDLIKIISYENNNAAFFSNKVLLVEGDSDLHFFKHVSKILNDQWNFDTKNIPIIRLHGKGNARRYKEFFNLFDIEVHTILDLDVIVKDFDKLDVSEGINVKRRDLMAEINEIVVREGIDSTPKSRKEVDKIISKHSVLEKYIIVKKIIETFHTSKFVDNKQARLFEDFSSHLFSLEENKAAKVILNSDEYDLTLKDELLSSLRNENIYVLRKGEVENYYPKEAEGTKLSRALKACDLLLNKEEILKLYPVLEDGKTELEVIFENIFN